MLHVSLWIFLCYNDILHFFLSIQAKERDSADGDNAAEKVANILLTEAKTLRTKDNTSIVFLDFDRKFRISCKVDS
jgi:protein phosphatase